MSQAMSERLAALGIAPTDLIISVSENTKADWSFGVGKAQFLTGELQFLWQRTKIASGLLTLHFKV